jgi:Ca2+-binding RTX toxin-like protein
MANITGTPGPDNFLVGAGSHIIDGGAGVDTVNYQNLNGPITLGPLGVVDKGDNGTDNLVSIENIIADAGFVDTIDASDATGTATINVDLSSNSAAVNTGTVGTLNFGVFNFDNVIGTNNNDTITGNNANNTLSGQSGDDLIDGKNGNDALSGDIGQDTLIGGGGKDILRGGVGNDNLSGDSGNDSLFGDTGNDTLSGGIGNDTLAGGVGNDVLAGGSGNDSLLGSVGDTLIGGSGSDSLNGGLGNDVLIGVGEGLGGGTIDTLTGGVSADTFVLGTSVDTYYSNTNNSSPGLGDYAYITDFNANFDTIQLNSNYTYVLGTSPISGSDTGIFIDNDGTAGLSANDELIGVLHNTILPGGVITASTPGFSFV